MCGQLEAFNPDRLAETEISLGRLLELFGVQVPPSKRSYDGKAKIVASPGSWQEQFEELYSWIVFLSEKSKHCAREMLFPEKNAKRQSL